MYGLFAGARPRFPTLAAWQEWGPPDDQRPDTWIWWKVSVFVKGGRFYGWHMWMEDVWVRRLSQLEEALAAGETAGMYVHRRIVLEEWTWDAEDGWLERDHL